MVELVSIEMERLCGRPGCSDLASVAYGMRAEDLVFWLDVPVEDGNGGGVLCRRHADAMVVPRGWTLDDLRDPELHLFRPPVASTRVIHRTVRTPRTVEATAEQLELLVGPETETDAATEADAETEVEVAIEPVSGPWTPNFDEADDLDGLLSARSPLLARAFRTADRPER